MTTTHSVTGNVIRETGATQSFPLTRTQLKIYTYCRINPLTTTYHTSLAFDIVGYLDVTSLEVCIERILERHEILRAQFVHRGSDPYFIIKESMDAELQLFEYSDIAALESDVASPLLHVNRPFDLARDDLARFALIRHADQHHTLCVVVHHLVTDLWSMNLLCSEISDLYLSCVEGIDATLPDVLSSFGEYARAEGAMAGIEARKRAVGYWRTMIAPGTSAVSLPSDGTGDAEEGEVERTILGAAAVRALNELCDQLQCTAFVLLLSAYFAFIYRLTSQSRISIGTFFSNRADPRLARVCGLLFNDLPITIEIDGEQTFEDLVASVKEQFLLVLPHASTAYDRTLVAEAASGLDGVAFEQHNVTFQLYEQTPNRLRLEGCEVVQRRFFYGSKYDLMLYASLGIDQLDLWFNFRADKYSAALIRGWVEMLSNLVDGLLREPTAPLTTHVLAPGAAEHLVAAIERNRLASSQLQTITEYLVDSVANFYEMVAVSEVSDVARRDVSYRELDAWSDRVGLQLQGLGVVTGDVVGVYCSRSADLIAAHIAVLKVGAICVPLNLDYPKERLRFILKNSGASVVVSNVVKRDHFAGVPVLDLGSRPHDGMAGAGPPVLSIAPNRESPSYLIYTSGSRGRPKGVLLSHKGIVNQILHRRSIYDASNEDAFCLSLSTGFVTAPLQILLPLFVGGRLLVYSEEIARDPRRLFRVASEDGVVGLEVTVSQLDEFIRSQHGARSNGTGPPKLPTVMVAGEKLHSATVTALHRLEPTVSLVNAYGQTECSGMTLSGMVAVSSNHPLDEGVSSLNNQVMILDDHGGTVPPGALGEVCVCGAGVALGYWTPSGLDQTNFVEHPIFGRMFRTGDLGRRRANDHIEVLGRRDDQVKLRGVRIEPGEIEEALRSVRGIDNCCVVARPYPKTDLALIAYICVGDARTAPMDAAIRSAIRHMLPEIMIPSQFCRLDRIPTSPNGKIDRSALPDPRTFVDANREKQAVSLQLSETEQVLTHLWATALGGDPIGLDDNFFRLGGNSLQAVVLVSEISSHFGVDLSLDTIFKSPSVRELSAVISRMR